MEKTGLFIMEPFNTVFFICSAFFIRLLAGSSVRLKDRPEKDREKVLISVCLVTLVGFFFYKYFLSIDAEFDAARRAMGMGGFNWWNELPLQLCNVNMILIPIAVLSKRRELLSFCFFVGPLGAAMALCMPTADFNGYSILLPRMIGFWGTHFMVFIEGIALVTFGLYRPRFKDIPGTVKAFFGIGFCAFLIDMGMRLSGLYPNANYFFAVETEGNRLLELFRSWIPLPFLYLLPSIVILVAYMAVVILICGLIEKIRGTKR